MDENQSLCAPEITSLRCSGKSTPSSKGSPIIRVAIEPWWLMNVSLLDHTKSSVSFTSKSVGQWGSSRWDLSDRGPLGDQ